MPGFFIIDGVAHKIALIRNTDGDYRLVDGAMAVPVGIVAVSGNDVWIHANGHAYCLTWQDAITHYAEEVGGSAGDVIRAPMPGTVVTINIIQGDEVETNDIVMVITSMKMEISLRASRAGKVQTIHVGNGGSFERDAILISLVPES